MTDGSNIPLARDRIEWVAAGLENGLIAPESAALMLREKVLPMMVRRSRKGAELEEAAGEAQA